MPVYNGASTIKKTLESLLFQDVSSYKLIIINDNSNDESISFIENFLENKKIDYKIINHTKSIGLAGSYNEGIKCAETELVVTMHQDILLIKKNSLRLLLEPFLNNKNVVASYHVVNHPYEIWKKYNFWQKCLFSRMIGKRMYGLDGKFDCFRKNVLKKVGLFDGNNFRRAGEDGDIINKLKKEGDIKKTEAEIVHLHSMDHNFGVKQFLYKQAQYAEAQGALLRRHGATSLKEFLRSFFREVLVISLFIPYVRVFSLVFIVYYAFVYTKEVYKSEWGVRIAVLPFVNIISLFISILFSLRGFIYGKQRI